MQPVSPAMRPRSCSQLRRDGGVVVPGRPAPRADEAALGREAVVEVAAVHLAEEVGLGADERVLDRRELGVAGGEGLDHASGGGNRMRRPGVGLQLVRREPGPGDRDLHRREPHVGGDERVAAELAHDDGVGVEAVLAEQPDEILPAAAGRLVQAGREDDELARERARPGHDAGRLGRAGGAPSCRRFPGRRRRRPRRAGLVRDQDRLEMPVEDDGRPRPAAAEASDHDRRRRERSSSTSTSIPISSSRRAKSRATRPCPPSGSRPRRARASGRGAGRRRRARSSVVSTGDAEADVRRAATRRASAPRGAARGCARSGSRTSRRGGRAGAGARILASVVGVVGVRRVHGAHPLPHVPGHVEETVRARAVRVAPDRGRAPCFSRRRAAGRPCVDTVGLACPRGRDGVGAPRGLLPLGLRRQPAAGQRQHTPASCQST